MLTIIQQLDKYKNRQANNINFHHFRTPSLFSKDTLVIGFSMNHPGSEINPRELSDELAKDMNGIKRTNTTTNGHNGNNSQGNGGTGTGLLIPSVVGVSVNLGLGLFATKSNKRLILFCAAIIFFAQIFTVLGKCWQEKHLRIHGRLSLSGYSKFNSNIPYFLCSLLISVILGSIA
jgi:hypothetical protein